MKKIIIGEPFGNFIVSEHATSVIGPFSTIGDSKGGLYRSILLKGRILAMRCGWPNQWAEMVIAARLLGRSSGVEGVEVLVPNYLTTRELGALFKLVKGIHLPIIIRPPMRNAFEIVQLAAKHGHKRFHVRPPLMKPITISSTKINRLHAVGLVRMLKERLPDIEIAAAGWMRHPEDAEVLVVAGADQLDASWMMTNPKMWLRRYREDYLAQVASKL
jgi:hypothetical protein